MNHELLHGKAITKAKNFHRAEADLIDILQELDQQKTFLHYRCTSLFEYCLKYLKLSESNTASFIRVARKSKEVPELKEAIRKQEITVSKARRITPVLNKENSAHWLELAKTLPKPRLEKEVAKVAPETLTPEKAKYVADDRIQLNIGVSEKTMQKLRRVQDLVSQKNRRSASMEDTLVEMLDLFLVKLDPVEKAKQLAQPNVSICDLETANSNNLHGPRPASKMLRDPQSSRGIFQARRKLLAQTKHQINLRDKGQCTHVQGGKRCENKRWLEVHHKIPLSLGGSNEVKNLTTLCWSHHRMQHSH